MEMKCDGTHTHLVTLICTMQDCVGGIFLCRYTVTNKENKMENKHLILFDHFKRHIYTCYFFSEILHGVRASHGDLRDRTESFEKESESFLKNGPKIRIFEFVEKRGP